MASIFEGDIIRLRGDKAKYEIAEIDWKERLIWAAPCAKYRRTGAVAKWVPFSQIYMIVVPNSGARSAVAGR